MTWQCVQSFNLTAGDFNRTPTAGGLALAGASTSADSTTGGAAGTLRAGDVSDERGCDCGCGNAAAGDADLVLPPPLLLLLLLLLLLVVITGKATTAVAAVAVGRFLFRDDELLWSAVRGRSANKISSLLS